jgi:UDP-glucose 4-epimerase
LVQVLHEEDAVDAFKLCIDADFSGVFNIAAEGVLPLKRVLAMAGRLSLPMPTTLAYPLIDLMWLTQTSISPATLLDFLRYLCVADTSQARRVIGFTPKRSIKQAIADFAGFDYSARSLDGARP